MKKFYYLAAGIVTMLMTIMACQTSEIGVDEIQTLLKEEALLSKVTPDLLSKDAPDKVTICHYDADLDDYFPISISTSALDKHMIKHGDKFLFSPEGSYIIYRDNGAVLNITVYSDGTIDGDGFTGGNSPKAQIYDGVVTVNQDNSISMAIHQTPQGGTHYIDGIVSECGGITELTTSDYSF